MKPETPTVWNVYQQPEKDSVETEPYSTVLGSGGWVQPLENQQDQNRTGHIWILNLFNNASEPQKKGYL